jgi:hypothetical protein
MSTDVLDIEEERTREADGKRKRFTVRERCLLTYHGATAQYSYMFETPV